MLPFGRAKLMNDIDELDNELPWVRKMLPGNKQTRDYGKIDPRSPVNAYLLLKHHHELAGKLVYDEFADKCLFQKAPPWDKKTAFRVRKVDDHDAFMAMLWLENKGVKQSKNGVMDAMLSVAQENRTNPAQEYFKGIKEKWDKTPRLETWLKTYLGADVQPKEYLAAVGKKWLTAIVGRAFIPGSKFDHVLILEGAQGIGKSTALRELATFGDEVFFYDGTVSFSDKDTLMALQGKIIVEMAELASFRKTDNEEIKAFISRTQDEYRTPYGRTIGERPRYFVLTGSTNEREYLPPDESGHRRYWPVECGKIDNDALRKDREQLWAEAATLYFNKFETWVKPLEISMFTLQQETRVIKDAWFDIIRDYLERTTAETITVDEIFERLSIQPRDRNNLARKRIKDTFRHLEWHEVRENNTGVRAWKKQ